MKIIMFAGAGSVGKTKLMQACLNLAWNRGMSATMHSSTTRDTYAKAGLTQESEALADPCFNREFQNQVMADNIAALEHNVFSAKNNGMQVLFADRTPHDYAGYYTSVFSDVLDLRTIVKKQRLADNTLSRMHEEGEIVIYMLPFPCYWSKDTESSDGWRKDTTGKNYIWSCVVEAEVNNIKRRLELAGMHSEHIAVKRLPPFFEFGTPEERALGILSQEFPLAVGHR